MGSQLKQVQVKYFAALREAAGRAEERVSTGATTLGELYEELRARYGFGLRPDQLKVARSLQVVDLSAPFEDGDELVFIPPVAGG